MRATPHRRGETNEESSTASCHRAGCARNGRGGGCQGAATERQRHRGRLEHGRALDDCRGGGLSQGPARGPGHGRHLRNGRRLREVLPRRDRSRERVTAIKSTEYASCQSNGIKWVAFTVANDGISLVTSRQNTWADCLTTAELKKIWNTGSKVDNWRDVRAGFPDVPLKLFGPGTDSGTFDFFTEFINGKAKASRSDYTASEDDNILVQGVSGTRGGLGYFGLSYYLENQSKLKLIKVDAGAGCVAPSVKTVQSRAYKPLSARCTSTRSGRRSNGPRFVGSSATR